MPEPVDQILRDTARQLFSSARLRDLEWHEAHLDEAAWSAVADAGLALIDIPESLGGVGGTASDIVAVAQEAGAAAAALPIVESHLASWLLARVGHRPSARPSTIAPGSAVDTAVLRNGRVHGFFADVPWADCVGSVVAVVPDADAVPHIVVLDPDRARLHQGYDLAGQPRDDLYFDGTPVISADAATDAASAQRLRLRGMLLRAAQMAGAIGAAARLTIEYTGVRHQFGKPIGAFQAVQQHVVVLAQVAALTNLAVARAARAAEQGEAEFEILSAKQLANDSARQAAAAAHQAHGAIGLTLEYPLHPLTRRLHAWQGEFGTSQEICAQLGSLAAKRRITDLISEPHQKAVA